MLAGGELAAMVVADTVLRKLPGVLGKDESALEESFSEALEGGLEYPHYTRPAEWRGWTVPEVLLSGHHERDPRMAPGAEPPPFATMIRPRVAAFSQPGAAVFPCMSTVIDTP